LQNKIVNIATNNHKQHSSSCDIEGLAQPLQNCIYAIDKCVYASTQVYVPCRAVVTSAVSGAYECVSE